MLYVIEYNLPDELDIYKRALMDKTGELPLDPKAYEIVELKESLKNCKDYLAMSQSEVESLQKEVKRLKLETEELKKEIK